MSKMSTVPTVATVATVAKAVNFVSLVIFLNVIVYTDARIHRTSSRGSRVHCDYNWVRNIERERDDLKDRIEYMRSSNTDLEIILTRNSCDAGQMFRYNKDNGYNIKCISCPENHYRSKTNTTCYHCPEGFYSSPGSAECKKAKTNTSNVHTLCKQGSIVGNNKFGYHLASCISCQSLNKRGYMPYDNNHDTCMTCPGGGVVNIQGTRCNMCPTGYFEKDNECVQCNIGTYTDKEGMTECKVCNNPNALAYTSVGGNNCEDSIFHDLAKTFNNNIMNFDIIFKPLVAGAHGSAAFLSNNEKSIKNSIPLLMGAVVVGWFMF